MPNFNPHIYKHRNIPVIMSTHSLNVQNLVRLCSLGSSLRICKT